MDQELLDAQLQRAYQQETAEYKKYGGPDGVNEDEEDTDDDFDGEQESDEEEEELDEKTKRLQEEVRPRNIQYMLYVYIKILNFL